MSSRLMERSMSEFSARNDDDVENNTAVNRKGKLDVCFSDDVLGHEL